jgi:hypothetical protein
MGEGQPPEGAGRLVTLNAGTTLNEALWERLQLVRTRCEQAAQVADSRSAIRD